MLELNVSFPMTPWLQLHLTDWLRYINLYLAKHCKFTAFAASWRHPFNSLSKLTRIDCGVMYIQPHTGWGYLELNVLIHALRGIWLAKKKVVYQTRQKGTLSQCIPITASYIFYRYTRFLWQKQGGKGTCSKWVLDELDRAQEILSASKTDWHFVFLQCSYTVILWWKKGRFAISISCVLVLSPLLLYWLQLHNNLKKKLHLL